MIELHTAVPLHIPFLNPMAPIGIRIQAFLTPWRQSESGFRPQGELNGDLLLDRLLLGEGGCCCSAVAGQPF